MKKKIINKKSKIILWVACLLLTTSIITPIYMKLTSANQETVSLHIYKSWGDPNEVGKAIITFRHMSTNPVVEIMEPTSVVYNIDSIFTYTPVDYISAGAYLYRYVSANKPLTGIMPKDGLVITLSYIKECSVACDPNGGIGDIVVEYIDVGMKYTLKEPSFTLPGYKFKCWNTAQDGSGVNLYIGNILMITNNVTFYAQWQKL